MSLRLSLIFLLVTSLSITATFQQPKILSAKQFGSTHQRSLHLPVHLKGLSSQQLNMVTDSNNNNDDISLTDRILFAIGGTTSITVAGTFFIVLAYQRDALMVSFFIGSILNGILSKVLKKVLNQDRPISVSGAVEQPSDKGMPSSHAMSLGFIGTFTALTIDWTGVPIALYGATSLYYRVQTKLHTKEQVAVGLLVGSINGALWRVLVDGNNPLLPKINIMAFVTENIMDQHGILPIPYLVVPVIVGALVVGSFERKVVKWIQKMKSKEL
jgi:membrane-associated phospholipid phosphatase